MCYSHTSSLSTPLSLLVTIVCFLLRLSFLISNIVSIVRKIHTNSSCCSVAQSCLTLCSSMDRSTPGFPDFTISRSLLKPMFTESVMPSNHLILCRPLLLLPSISPSIGVFPNESAHCLRWPKYWRVST